MKKIVIGTRGSALALYQARRVAKELREIGYNGRIEEKIILATRLQNIILKI